MRNPKDAFHRKQFLRGKDVGKAFLEDEVRRRLNLKPFFTDEEKFIFERKVISSEDDRRAFNKYVKLLEYLDDRKRALKIHKIELDRQIAWRVCFLNGFISEAQRLLNEPLIITAKMDEGNTTIYDDDLHLIRKEKIVASFSDRDIASPKRLKLTPLQEKQREFSGVALLVRSGINHKITDREYELPAYASLEQLRTDKINIPDPDFKGIQYCADMMRGILQVFNIIGAEVGLDIPKAYGETDIESVFQNARGYNSLYVSVLGKLSKTHIKPLYTNYRKYLKMIDLDKEITDSAIDKVGDEVHNLKAFDFNIGRGVGNRLETMLFKK